MTKLILLRAINLARYLSCSIFENRLAPWTTNMCLDRLDFLEKFLPQWFNYNILFWQTGQGGEWQVILGLGSHQIIHDVGSLRISTMWLFNFFLLERTLKQELQKWQNRPRRIWLSCPPPTPGCPAYPPHPSSSPPSPPSHHHPPCLLPILLLLPLLQEFWKASRPSLLSCRDL